MAGIDAVIVVVAIFSLSLLQKEHSSNAVAATLTVKLIYESKGKQSTVEILLTLK